MIVSKLGTPLIFTDTVSSVSLAFTLIGNKIVPPRTHRERVSVFVSFGGSRFWSTSVGVAIKPT